MLSRRKDFFYVKHFKKRFYNQKPFPTRTRTHNFFSQDCISFKAGGLENPSPVSNLPNTSLLGVRFRKAGGLEKCGLDLKKIFFWKIRTTKEY